MTEEKPEESNASNDAATDEDQGEQLEASAPGDVGDDLLPDDLKPTEDNPLARHPSQTGNEEDTIGADREEDPETAPLTADDADYGSGAGSSSSSDGSDGSGGSGDSSGGDGPDDGRVKAEEDDGSDTLDNGGGGAG